jgi:hypothetical protein
MGNPVECEHANPDNGDTLQNTTTGLAFYRKSTNTPTFTNGTEHWALTTEGEVYWTGGSIDPSADAQLVLPPEPIAQQSPSGSELPPTPALPPAPPAQPIVNACQRFAVAQATFVAVGIQVLQFSEDLQRTGITAEALSHYAALQAQAKQADDEYGQAHAAALKLGCPGVSG